MSQVRKFDKGGTAAQTEQQSSTEAKKKYRLIINGKEMLLDDDSLAAFRKAGSGQGGMMGNVYADIADALQAGKTVKYNSDSNTISGVDFKRVDPTAIAKANENQIWDKKAQRRANRYARRNNLTHQFNSALASIGNINFYKPEDETTSSDSSSKLSLFGSYNPFQYNVDDEGNTTFANSPLNATAKKYIDAYANLATLSREQAKEKYNFDDEKYDQFMNWYNTYGQNYNWIGEGDSLWNRIQNKNYNENDDELLELLGWHINNSSDDSSDSTNTSRSYEGSGFNNDALEQAGYYVKKDKDGNVYLYDNNGNVVQDKIYLKGAPWANGSIFENGVVYKGRLYTNDQIMNQNNEAKQAISPLFDAMHAAKTPEEVRQAALNSTWKIYGMDNESPYDTYDSKSTYLKGFNDLFQNGTYYWNDITGNYNLGNNPNTRILSIYGTERNPDGTFKEQYAVSDNNGNAEILDGIEALQNYLNRSGITKYVGYNPYKPLRQYDSVINNGKRYIRMDNPYKIADRNIDIYRDENGKYYVADSKGGFTELYGNNIMEAIKNGTATHEDLRIGSKQIQNPDQKWWWSSQRKWMEGFDKSNYQPGAYDEFFNYYKKGGKIQKKQFGGLMSSGKHGNTNTEASDFKVGQATKAFGTPKELKTSTDRMSKAAGWLDTAGAAATFIPGYGNVAGAITGTIGSLLRLGADIQRDGAQLSDFTKFAGNIGLDLLTLIPGAGSAAKAAKIAKGANAIKDTSKISKGIKQVAEPVLNFIGNNSRKITGITSGAGIIGGGAMVGSSLFGDNEFTSDDFATAAQGALGVTGGIKNLHNLKKSTEAIQTIAGKKTFDKIKNQEGDKWGKRVSNAWKNWRGNRKTNSENNKSVRSLMFNDRLVNQTLQESLKNNPDLRKLATDKNGHLDEALFSRLQNEMGKFLSRTGQTYTLNGKTIIGKQIKPSWYNGQQFTVAEKSNILALPPHISTGPVNPIKPSVLQLPAWNAPKGKVNQININEPIITPPRQGMLQLPQFASSYQNAQGQLILPRGNGRFFKKTQRVWNGGPTHTINPIQPSKYSRTPSAFTKRNFGLEQAHKQRVLQEAGRQQVPAIRGLQEDMAKVRTSEDFKNLLIKINNRGSYKEIIKNNPEIKDQLRQMFVHLDPVRLGNWMTKYNLRFKQGGKIIKAQPGTKFPYGKFVIDESSVDPNLFNYQKSGIQFNGSNVDWTKTYDNGTFMNYRQQYLNNWDNATFKPVIDAYLAQLSKGNNNVDLSNFSKEDFARLTQDQKLGYAHNLYTDAFANYLKSNTPTTVLSRGPLTGNTPTLNVSTPELDTPAPILSKEQMDKRRRDLGLQEVTNPIEMPEAKAVVQNPTGLIARNKEEWNGSNIGNIKQGRGFNWNPDDLIGLANLGYSVHKNNQMYGVLEDSIKDAGKGLMKEMPTEIYDRYQDHITPVYQEAANAKRQWIPISTDPLLNYSMRQVNEDAAQALLTEGRLKASEQYTDYLDKDLAARRMYADQRRQIADTNRAMLANIIMQLGQNDVARRLANNQSVQNYVGEMRTKLAQDRQKKKQFQLQDARVQAQNEYNRIWNTEGNKYITAFRDLGDDERKKYSGWQDWLLQNNVEEYNKIQNLATTASQNIMQDFYPGQLDYFNYRPTQLVSPTSATRTSYYGKKGGKTPTYLKRHTGQKPDEAIWIQRNKDTAKALEKLHDAVIKLFMKSIS